MLSTVSSTDTCQLASGSGERLRAIRRVGPVRRWGVRWFDDDGVVGHLVIEQRRSAGVNEIREQIYEIVYFDC
jgi:hypothetical protein